MNDKSEQYWDWHKANGYSKFVNASGTMTPLGGSITSKSVQKATVAAMGRFVKIHELQTHASRIISKLTNAETGYITASASAGITLAVAGCMTGLDAAKAEALPKQAGDKNQVVIQAGHLCSYGAPVSTAIELTGATVVPFGQSTGVADYQFEAALTEHTAAALYVVSHHVVHYGQIPFDRFVEIAHAKNIPVIVDAASEYDLCGFIEKGADLVIYSGHKFLGGPTSGIIAGKSELVRAAYLQNIGIGRGMKVGKESIAGVIAAMEAWMERDHAAIRKKESATLELWSKALQRISGITTQRVNDPIGNPLERLQVNVDEKLAGASAASFARALGEYKTPVIVRAHEVELGYFQLDPCNLAQGHAEIVAYALKHVMPIGVSIKQKADDLPKIRNGGVDGYLNWKA